MIIMDTEIHHKENPVKNKKNVTNHKLRLDVDFKHFS